MKGVTRLKNCLNGRMSPCTLYAVIYRRQSHDNPGGAGSSINLMQLSVSERSTSPPSTPSSINSAPLLVFPLMETHRGGLIESVCLTVYSLMQPVLADSGTEPRSLCQVCHKDFFIYFLTCTLSCGFPSANTDKRESEEVVSTLKGAARV